MDIKTLIEKTCDTDKQEISKPKILSKEQQKWWCVYLARENGDITNLSPQAIMDISFDAVIQKFINDNGINLRKNK